ncbi:MAG TPA: TraB/GumN family protein [Phycisphaerae bacterium]|nr:TraB/GumN family protein [Phycisphaerae bacterium]
MRSRFIGTAFTVAAGMYFAVVGGGHLVGPKGIVRLLEEKKYAVEQLDKSPEPLEATEPQEKPAEPAAEAVAL